ncbi:MAG: ABC transporter ATP-binding protein, partial [Holophagales bacterium]|nr:ABC transporter ATP-binding protein [Holophagales bacterium]
MGFSSEETDAKIPEILDFSELDHFIDRPIKTYSSGMAMRLGFAIAAQVNPEVLIIDEALSVGDGYFQKKCMDKIRALLDEGCTFLFCSHAMYYVSTFCERALWLRDGKPLALGPVADVVREYESFLLALRRGEGTEEEPRSDAAAGFSGSSPARILDIRSTGGEPDG